MQNNLLVRVYFPGVGLSDTVIAVAGAAYTVPLPTVSAFPTINSQFYIEHDADGLPILCTVKTNQSPLTVSFTTAGTVKATPLPAYDLIGGHPIHRPPSNS